MSLKVFFATVFVISQNHYDFLSSNWTFTKVLYQLSSQKCFLVNSSFLQNSFTDKAWNCFGNAFKYYLKRVVCVENWFLHSNLTIFKSVCFTKQFPEFYLKTLISIYTLLGTTANIILLRQTNYHNWLIISNTTFRSSCKPHRWSLTQYLITYTTLHRGNSIAWVPCLRTQLASTTITKSLTTRSVFSNSLIGINVTVSC